MRKFLVLLLVLCWGLVGCESEEAVVPGEDTSLNQTDPDADQGEPDADQGEPDADQDEPDADDLEPGQCLTNDDCEGADVYCDRPPGCADRGECTTIPTDIMCSMVITPYCDCNGESQESPTGCVYDAYRHLGPCTVDD